ncbi:MAG: hypothetical protein OQK74_01640, partial [Gammaproteobacteria bacterium]|nr:hypothetical protein [Gammaproteobacteria bacterium]
MKKTFTAFALVLMLVTGTTHAYGEENASSPLASVDKLKTLGVDSLVFDPCGNVPEQGDFLTVMRS